jgi:hypothetical protein
VLVGVRHSTSVALCSPTDYARRNGVAFVIDANLMDIVVEKHHYGYSGGYGRSGCIIWTSESHSFSPVPLCLICLSQCLLVSLAPLPPIPAGSMRGYISDRSDESLISC